ncbi:hypothetical protein ACLOJK_037223 [Asimina triloba]
MAGGLSPKTPSLLFSMGLGLLAPWCVDAFLMVEELHFIGMTSASHAPHVGSGSHGPNRGRWPSSSTVGSGELGAVVVIAIEEDNRRMIEHRSLSPLPRSLVGLAVTAAYLSSPYRMEMGFGAAMAAPCVGDGAPYLGAPVVYGARCTCSV